MKISFPTSFPRHPVALSVSLLAAALAVTACGGDNSPATLWLLQPPQPVLSAQVKGLITRDSRQFKDLNGNGKLDPYEDWRLSVEQRVDDLVSRMSLEEKTGMMMINDMNAGCAGAVTATASDYIGTQKMTRFILRSVAKGSGDACDGSVTPGRGGYAVTPQQLATYTNAIQKLAEATPLGIPVVFKDNARNHFETDPRVGVSAGAGAFTEFSKEAGLASAALGEEFLKTGTTTVAMTMKHFPGGGPQEQGLDPHYSFGKNQAYPGNNFAYHLKPFMAGINAGVSAIMPYYGVPINVTYEGVKYDQVGMAFSRQIVTDLLRGKLGFKGYVNSDTGIINDRAWGLEDKTVPERVAIAINGGTDTLSGFSTNKTITDLVKSGLVTEARVNEAVKRLLTEQFKLGLFENPYIDASKANATIGSDANRAKGLEIQKKSVVLLQNQDLAAGKTLPLKAGAKVYTMGMGKADVEKYGYAVTDGNYDASKGQARPSAAGADYTVIRVLVKDKGSAYSSKDPATGANPLQLNPLTGKTWGSQDPCVLFPLVNATCSDTGLLFGGALPWEANDLTFTGMAAATSRVMTPSLADIQAIMKEVGDPKKVVLNIYFRAPYVLDDASGLKNAGAIVAGFGVSDTALLEVLSGKFKPQGKMPFALPKTQLAVEQQQSDVPGYKETRDGALYPFGFGLTY